MDDELAEIRRKKMQQLLQQAQAPQQPTATEPMSNGVVNLLVDSTFWPTIQKTRTALVDFYGEWCSPCKMLAPIFSELAQDYRGKVFFGKIDIDKNPRTTAQFGVQSVPMIIAFRDGKPIGQIPGLRTYTDYDLLLQKLLGSQ